MTMYHLWSNGRGTWALLDGLLYKSILCGLFEVRPSLVTVVSGLHRILFSFISERVSLRILKHLFKKSQNALPTSRSPFRQDLSLQNMSSVALNDIEVNLLNSFISSFLSLLYKWHSNIRWNSDSTLLQWIFIANTY